MIDAINTILCGTSRLRPRRMSGTLLTGLLWAGLGCLSVGAATPATDASATAATPAPVEVRSNFINDPRFGKDPFFPESKRREGQIPAAVIPTVVVDPNASLESLWQMFTLKGISISSSKRLAIFNRYTFEEGEEREIKVNNQVIKVRCVTVNEESAVFEVRGKTKELKLRTGI